MTEPLRMLTDRQKVVIETMRLHLNETQSLTYLKSFGFEITARTLYKDKKKVNDAKLKRLYHIARIGFEDQHLETIDELNMSFKMMWTNVLRERDPYKQNQMIKDIIMLKPYLSAYYEATKYIVEKQPIVIEKEDNNNESEQDSSSLPTIKRSSQESNRSTDTTNLNRKF